ncbi:MAG: DinB family protein [Phycisphaerae bacterium]
MNQADLLAEELDGTRDWTLKLLADLSGDDWKFMPGDGLPHALWLCGHFAVAQHLLVHVRCLSAPVLEDSFIAHFPIGAPVKSTTEHDYPSPETILQVMETTHAQTIAAIKGMGDALLAEPATGAEGKPHPHYRDKRGAVMHCNRHEAFHAGQLATIRRLLGKPFLR